MVTHRVTSSAVKYTATINPFRSTPIVGTSSGSTYHRPAVYNRPLPSETRSPTNHGSRPSASRIGPWSTVSVGSASELLRMRVSWCPVSGSGFCERLFQ